MSHRYIYRICRFSQ
uniref:Uncharacterized protein n=1 Tax=Anguilla anguilla TaxID=7936 RepID=A0A0E9PGH4_ANGAN